jgi:FtsP/CotA-like multicopper oxidase with cupredoxin domain
MHVFHIHQVHFQLVAINGVPQPFDGVANVVRVPERGSVTLRIAFTDPQIVGRFMYHCHVLKHEDQGMMANIEVYLPGAPSQDELGAVLPATYSRALCFTH